MTQLIKQLSKVKEDCEKVAHSIVAPLPIESVTFLPSKEVSGAVRTVNRMFTTLESKGIVRTTPQEFQLSADYDEKDI